MTGYRIAGLVCACAVASSCSRSSPAAPKSEARPPALVKVAPVEGGTLRQPWRFAGEVQASARSELAAGASGAVWRVTVREGDRLERGQLLVQVDDRLARAQAGVAQAEVSAAEQNLEQARIELRRLKSLREGLVPAIELDRAQTAVSVAEAQVERSKANLQEARARLALTAVRAPFDGAVVRRLVDPGAWVQPGDPVLQVVSSESPEIRVDASSRLLSQLEPGDMARGLRSGGESIPLKVLGVVPALDPVRRTVRIRLRPEDGSVRLVPGAAFDVEFDLKIDEAGVIVPRDALLVSPSEVRLAKIVDGEAEIFPAEVVARGSTVALVRSDRLQVGDQVVVQGNERLRPGQVVKVADAP